jgi:hypothetical protein
MLWVTVIRPVFDIVNGFLEIDAARHGSQRHGFDHGEADAWFA